MSASQAESQMMQILIGGACLVIIVAGMRAMAHVLNIVFLAWLLAYAILPLPNWMMRHRVPDAPAVIGTLLIVIFGGIALAVVMSYSIVGLGQRLPTYETNLADTYSALVNYLAARDIDLAQIRPLEWLTPSRVIGYARMILGQIGNLLGNTLLLVLLVAILLFEFLEEDKRLLESRAEKRPIISIFQAASSDVQAYVAVTSTTGAVRGLDQYHPVSGLGHRLCPDLGDTLLFMNFIPIIGGFIAIVPPVALGFLESGVMTAVAVCPVHNQQPPVGQCPQAEVYGKGPRYSLPAHHSLDHLLVVGAGLGGHDSGRSAHHGGQEPVLPGYHRPFKGRVIGFSCLSLNKGLKFGKS